MDATFVLDFRLDGSHTPSTGSGEHPDVFSQSAKLTVVQGSLVWIADATFRDASQDMVSSRKRAIAQDQTDRARAFE